MPPLEELLVDSVPTDFSPLDHEHLAACAVGVRRRRRAGVASVGCVALLVAAIGVTMAVRTEDDRTDLASAPIAPDGTPLVEGFGEWHEGAKAPIDSLYSAFDGVLSDGRVLVWGGYREGEVNYSAAGEQRGAIYDPEADEWTEIPAPPVALSEPQVRLGEDRMLVMGSTKSGTLGGVVYDTQAEEWSLLPSQSEISVFADNIAWDGNTAVLVRVDEGGRGYADHSGIDWTVNEPVTLRWNFGDESWTRGAPAPLPLRFGAGTLAQDGQIYVVGGTERSPYVDNPPGPGEAHDPSARADGAVYDIQADRWTALPDLPQPGIHVHVGQLEDGTVLAGGALPTLQPSGEEGPNEQRFGLGPSWTLNGSTWNPYPAHPDPGAAAVVNGGIVQTSSLTGHSGPQPEWINIDGAWEQAPLSDLHRWEHLLIATSGTIDNPDDGPFTVILRASRDNWVTSASAPFMNRMDAVIQVTGNRLVVIGGFEGPDLAETSTVWVLDLTAGS